LFIIGCNSKYSKLSKIYDFKSNSKLEGIIVDIKINDKRENIEDRKLKIPALTFPGDYDKVSPVLTETQKAFIDSFVRSNFTQTNATKEIIITILKGEKEFKANAFSEVENVYFDVKIELLDVASQTKVFSSATIHFTFSSMDASNNFLDSLFNKAIAAALHKSIELLAIEQK
jgi:hypothetical protein